MESKHWLCERCDNTAYIAHHKEYLTPENIDDPNISLNWDNLEAVCLNCHNLIHGVGSKCEDEEQYTFTPEGDLIPIGGIYK